MKSRALTLITVMTVFALLAAPIGTAAQDGKGNSGYQVSDLGTLGGTVSNANGINNKGWLAGYANLTGDQTSHAVLWQKGTKIVDLGTLGGPTSAVDFLGIDDRGLVVGTSDTSSNDSFNENFCGTGDGFICLGFLWQDGVMTALPTLGGNNGWAFDVNARGQVVGVAENSTQDPICIPPQVFDWEAVIWGPKKGDIHELSPLSGDAVAGAVAINDPGQVVGTSGACASPSALAHAVLWQDGSATNLGNLGGALNNIAFAINNQGQIVGQSDLPGDTTTHAFLWTDDGGMQDLGTLSGDLSSVAFGINSKGQVVGNSCDASGNCRAFLWENGVMTDLNTLVCPGTSLYLTTGNDINAKGEIAGEAYDPNSGDTPGFLAVPSNGKGHCEAGSAGQRVILPENIRQRALKPRFGRFEGWMK